MQIGFEEVFSATRMSSAKAALVARIAALQRAREEEGDVVFELHAAVV